MNFSYPKLVSNFRTVFLHKFVLKKHRNNGFSLGNKQELVIILSNKKKRHK